MWGPGKISSAALPDAGLALAGSINWYDYTWSLDALRERVPDWEERLRTKRFFRGRHNDARFVRWPLDDVRFAESVVGALSRHMDEASRQAARTIVITHHPAFYGLSFPRSAEAVSADGLLWEAFSGNRKLEEVLLRHEERIPLVFSGHTHRERENHLGKIRGFNIGGDYHFKRLLMVEWPAGTVQAHVFGTP
jgi:hypothetical protein